MVQMMLSSLNCAIPVMSTAGQIMCAGRAWEASGWPVGLALLAHLPLGLWSFLTWHIFPSREEQPTEHLSGRIPTFVLKIGQACVCSHVEQVWPRGTCFDLCSGASCGHTDLGSRAPLYCSDPGLCLCV